MSLFTVRLGLALLLACCLGAAAKATTCGNPPYTFSNGTIADANQVNSNFSTIYACGNNSLAPLTRPALIGPLTMTGVLSGTSTTTNYNFAFIGITDTSTNTIAAPDGPHTNGLFVEHQFSTGEGNRNAIFAILEPTGTVPLGSGHNFFTSIFGYMKVTQATSGGAYFGFGGLTQIFAGTNALVKGAEFDTSINAGAGAAYHSTISAVLVNGHAVRGTFDAAFSMTRDSFSPMTWKKGIVFGDSLGYWPFDTDSTLIGSDAGGGGSPARVADLGIDLRNITFTTAQIIGTGWNVLADGSINTLGNLVVTNSLIGATLTLTNGTVLVTTNTNFANGAAGNTGTLTNSPAAGNPTKWIAINDNGTVRHIPAW